jgi:hypothetical protein
MKTLTKFLALTALALMGCSGPTASVADDSQAIALSALPPDLPGCSNIANARVTVRHIDGVDDLYVAYEGGQPVCIDSGEDIVHHFTAGVTVLGDSNPMPGIVSSNPMPGTDPGQSNPMPGQPTYGQGYTSGH